MNKMVTQSLQQQSDLQANRQAPKRETKNNLENEKEYVRIAKTRYQNLMLVKRVLRTKERPLGHRSFLP